MLRKWTRIILLLLGIFLLVLIAKNIKIPFWQDQHYWEMISNFQKNQDILPYRIRVLWWNNSIIFTTVIERMISLVWAGDYFFLPMICLAVLIKKRKWLSLGLVIIGLILISIEKDPNPGNYLLWLSPLVVAGFI